MPNKPSEPTISGGRAVGKSEMEQGITRNEEYDERHFYIRSIDNDKNRDSTRVDSMKCPPYLNARVQKWANDPRTPYVSASDFWRDAGAHRIHQLEEWDKDSDFDWGYLGIAEQRERLAREARDMHQQTEAFHQDFNQAIAQGDYHWINELLELGKIAVEQFREPYRTRVLQVIQPHLDGKITLAQRNA